MRLFKTARAEFLVNYHSNGRWLLYNEGWQIGTPTADDPIYYALSGNLDRPAIEGFHPGLSSDVLYVTNGEIDGYAQEATGTLAWTPELSPGCPTCGFVFPDDEALVAEEFERNLPFAESVAGLRRRPRRPEVVARHRDQALLPGERRRLQARPPVAPADLHRVVRRPAARRRDRQAQPRPGDREVADQRRPQDLLRPHPRVATAASGTGMTSTHYHQVRGIGPRHQAGRLGSRSGSRRAASAATRSPTRPSPRAGNQVLVMAAEDYTGASPEQGAGPHYLDYYLDALPRQQAPARTSTTWTRKGRVAPDALGVLSHYDAVVWYTGDDVVTRTTGRGAGNVDRLALDEMLELRAFMNEGGKVMYTGDQAGAQYTGNLGTQLYDPQGTIACNPLPAGVDPRRCLRAARLRATASTTCCSTGSAATSRCAGDGLDENGDVYDVAGIDDPFDGPELGDQRSRVRATTRRHVVVHRDQRHCCPVEEFPQFASWPSARWDKPGGPFDPHTGEQYVYSQIADVSYKRLTRTVTVPAGGGTLDFWTSYDTEGAWDHVFVEARTAGGDDWTTLPDVNGHTTQETGDSCAAGWRELHPQLDHYQTFDAATGTCTPDRHDRASGTPRRATPAAGRSGASTSSRWAGSAGGGLDLLRQRLGHPEPRRRSSTT